MPTKSNIKYAVLGVCAAAFISAVSAVGSYFGCISPEVQRAERAISAKGDLEKKLRKAEQEKKASEQEKEKLEKHNQRLRDEVVLADINIHKKFYGRNKRLEDKVENPPNNIDIMNLRLGEYIQGKSSCDWSYKPRNDSVYKKGKAVYAFYELKCKTVDGEYKVRETHEFFGQDGKIIQQISGVNHMIEGKSSSAFTTRKIPRCFGTAQRELGTYTWRITCVDMLDTKNRFVKEIQFTID